MGRIMYGERTPERLRHCELGGYPFVMPMNTDRCRTGFSVEFLLDLSVMGVD